MGGWGGVGGPCDYCVSPSPFDLDFGTLDFGTSDSGLTIIFLKVLEIQSLNISICDTYSFIYGTH